MNFDLYQLISIVLLVVSVFSIYFVINECLTRWSHDRYMLRMEMRRFKKHNKLAKIDPWFQLQRLENANWAQRNNKPTAVIAKMNHADYSWKKQRDLNNPQLELFN